MKSKVKRIEGKPGAFRSRLDPLRGKGPKAKLWVWEGRRTPRRVAPS